MNTLDGFGEGYPGEPMGRIWISKSSSQIHGLQNRERKWLLQRGMITLANVPTSPDVLRRIRLYINSPGVRDMGLIQFLSEVAQ